MEIPSPEDAFVALLGFFGVPASILLVFGSALAIKAWYDSVGIGLRAVSTAVEIMARSHKRGPRHISIAILVSLLVPCGQVLTLILCYMGGNYVEVTVNQSRWIALVDRMDADGLVQLGPSGHLLDWTYAVTSNIWNSMHWSPVTTIYVSLAALILLLSYRWAAGEGDGLGVAGAILAAPATALLILLVGAVALLLLAGVLWLGITILGAIFGGEPTLPDLAEVKEVFLPFLIGTTLTVLYFLACQSAVHASRLVRGVWSRE